MASTETFFPPTLSILGGIPLKGQDLAASIIFAIAYFLLLPLVFYRLLKPSSRCWQLLRPTIFVLIRIGTFIIRAIIANGNYATGFFVAEQPLVSLAKLHVTRNHSAQDGETSLLQKALRLLQAGLLVAIILGVVAGTKYGDLNNAATLATVKTYREANGGICLAVSLFSGVLVIFGAVTETLPLRQTLYLLLVSALLTIVSVTKLCLYLVTPTPSPIHAGPKAIFYCLVALPELLVCILYLAENLNTAFEIPEAKEKARLAKQGVQQKQQEDGGEMGQGGDYPPASYVDASYSPDNKGEKARKVAKRLPIVRHFV